MNRMAEKILMDKLSRRDSNSSQDRRSRDQDFEAGYNDGYRDGYDKAKYEIKGEYDREMDGARRRSKTTGRYMSDRANFARLTNHDIAHWEKNLKNADGTRGKHFDMHQVEDSANKLGIRFDEYSEKELCMVMNMLYSDLGEACRGSISPEKEAYYYAKMAQAWLEDDDGPAPSEKLALYYYCIVDDE